VAIWLPNSPAFVAAFLATLRTGAIAAPFGVLLTAREVRLRLEIARADLRLRGAGDLEGARQSGEAAGFRFLDPLADEALVAHAANDVAEIFSAPNALDAPELAGLRRALARFDADAAARELGIARGEAG